MSYPMDLDEYSDARLLGEISRRSQSLEDGLCSYCNQPIASHPYCLHIDRHVSGGSAILAALGDVFAEYQRAKEKHGEMTLDGAEINDLTRLAALMEEVGEVAEHLTYDKPLDGMRKELIQVANVAATWATVVQ